MTDLKTLEEENFELVWYIQKIHNQVNKKPHFTHVTQKEEKIIFKITH